MFCPTACPATLNADERWIDLGTDDFVWFKSIVMGLNYCYTLRRRETALSALKKAPTRLQRIALHIMAYEVCTLTVLNHGALLDTDWEAVLYQRAVGCEVFTAEPICPDRVAQGAAVL